MIFSIICPALNEEQFIEGVIQVFLKHCPQPSELFVADGGSTDATKRIVTKWSEKHPNIQLVNNERKFVSYAFNDCFPLTKGKYIGLVGAHTEYPADFFKVALEKFETTECDVVGGSLNQKGKTDKGKAISYCMSTPIGVGNTEFRTAKKEMFVDSVAFAIYKRSVLEQTGLLDTDLVRNQDDELHYRINANGFKILMTPGMESVYYVREDFKSLFKQYFEYGLYKPLVLNRVRSGFRLRHIVPALFVFYLLILPFFWHLLIFRVPLLMYLIVILITSLNNTLPFRVKKYCPTGFLVLHISYGLGFLLGIQKIFKLNNHRDN